MAGVAAPVILAEMAEWTALGGGNSGIVGNASHVYGFHCPANRVPTSDYSRRRDPAGPNAPVNWNWACAGDFSHDNKPYLRAMHVTLLARLTSGDPKLSMICEFIGKPWSDKPVYYWSRWDNELKLYKGAGHDRWSHISWYRSRSNQRAYLWVPSGGGAVTPAPTPTSSVPRYPGYVMGYNPSKYDANVKTWQGRMKQRGWTIGVDGLFGSETLRVVKAFQTEKRLGSDGLIGPVTWGAAWSLPVS